jgi:hypothetical protein
MTQELDLFCNEINVGLKKLSQQTNDSSVFPNAITDILKYVLNSEEDFFFTSIRIIRYPD